MRRFSLLLLALVVPALRAQDDELDKTVDGKRASEWMKVLRGSDDVRMRYRALVALEKAGPQTRMIFGEVGSALRLDKNEKLRVYAAQTLGKLATSVHERNKITVEKISLKDCVLALAASLEKEKTPAVREAAAIALGRTAAEAGTVGVVALRDVLKDPTADVRAAAAESLARIGPEARTILKEIIEAIRDARSKEDVRMRSGLVSTVQRIGKPAALPAVPVLLAVLEEKPLADLSLDESRKFNDFRRHTVETLGLLGDAAALSTLLKVFTTAMDTRDADMARTSLTALTDLAGDKKPLVPVLMSAMTPPPTQLQDRFVRCQAIHALGQLGKDLGEQRKTAVANLRRCLADKLGEVKLASALALGELGVEYVGEDAPTIIADLQVLTKSSEKAISEAATAAIARLEKKKP